LLNSLEGTRKTNHIAGEMGPLHSAVIWCVLLSILGHSNGIDRNYYIAAVEEKWDYAPSGINKLTGVSLDDDE
jgi:hypothetical protein